MALDGLFGGVQTISVSNAPITLTAPAGSITPSPGPTQAQNAILKITGTTTGPVAITLPLPGYYIIDTTGLGLSSSNVVTLRAAGTGQIIGLPFATVRHVYNDGTNVKHCNLQEVGTYTDYAGTAVPTWITSCTVPPFLNCDGSTFSGTTYPLLAVILGGTTLPDLRGVARYTLNQGTGRLTSAASGLDGNTLFAIKTTQSTTLITANLPPYTPAGAVTGNTTPQVPNPVGLVSLQGGGAFQTLQTNSLVTPIIINGTVVGTPQGGTSTPFGIVGPGTVAGITMIRAG